jgi:O-6-methylguanine DNA methyltransferase
LIAAYGSNEAGLELRLAEMPEQLADAGVVEAQIFRWIKTPLGTLLAAAIEEGITRLEFDRESQPDQSHMGTACDLPEAQGHLDQLESELVQYFAGERTAFSVPVLPSGSDFERRAWKFLCEIPFGQTRSYGQQAKAIAGPNAARAVGRANGSNPIAIVIPCHRVIGANGSLTGYGGGLDRKMWLLKHEGAAPALFRPAEQPRRHRPSAAPDSFGYSKPEASR